MKRTISLGLIISIFIAIIIYCLYLFGIGKNLFKFKNTALENRKKIENLRLPDGFRAERLYGPSENGEGSWVSMTFDGKGRIIASDQFGGLYRLTIPAIGDSNAKTSIEKLEIGTENSLFNNFSSKKLSIGYAQGLLWAFNSLYVMINHIPDEKLKKGSGLYRLEDEDGDGKFEKVTLLKELEGDGEHGPHSIVLSPDKQSLYVIAGNFTQMPKMNRYRNIPSGDIDNLFPYIKDPNGHDNTVGTKGGWIAKLDSTGKDWELIASGLRNPFDLAFNNVGDMFTYDSDMEWDFGTPWYRPTRICHVTSGAEFGWRPGTAKWSPNYPDNLPATLNIGQGSPTNLVYGANARFPKKYRNAFFAFDWSFGIIYAIYPEADGATYKTKGEEFVSGSPLALTDGVIGADGALYFLTGGRKLESDLYRVYYNGKLDKDDQPEPVALTEPQKLRRQLETYHSSPQAGAVDFSWPHLKDDDRFIRFASRVAIENQPVEQWQEKVLTEKDPIILTNAAIALAHKGNATIKNQLLQSIAKIQLNKLNTNQQLDVIRAIELTISRMGMPDNAAKTAVIHLLNPLFPAKTNDLNRELSKLLVFLEAPKAIDRTIALLETAKDDSISSNTMLEATDLILRNPDYGIDIAAMLAKIPPQQQTWYANVLSKAKNGWNPELQKKYFEWYYKAFSFKGGNSFVGYINESRSNALLNVTKDKFEYYNTISGDSIVKNGGNALEAGAIRPKGPGRKWIKKEALAIINSGMDNRNFEQGKAMFAASLCKSCHQIQGEGGISGPNLTQLGTRFSYSDMLEAIILPNKTISDQFGSTVFYLKEGGTILGRLMREDNVNYYISQNPFAPEMTRTVVKSNVLKTRISEISPMLPGMINGLNEEELKDLIAYLKSGGNKKHPIYAKK
jgi:putative heme-binding domain-containing protein